MDILEKYEKSLVVGHINPDTDAICSAIGYAAYLRAIGVKEVEAIRCGSIPARTQWVLQQSDMVAPRLLEDIRMTASHLAEKKDRFVFEDDNFLVAYKKMLKHAIKSLPVLDKNYRYVGMLDLHEMLSRIVPVAVDNTTIKDIYLCLHSAQCLLDGCNVGVEFNNEPKEELFSLFVAASSLPRAKRMLEAGQSNNKQIIAICGDREDIHQMLIEQKVHTLIITGDVKLALELRQLAQQKHVRILEVPHDTATTLQLLRFSRLVKLAQIQREQQHCFVAETTVEEIKQLISSHMQDVFPVVDSKGIFIGSFAKLDLIQMSKSKLILVDHNEYSQAIVGAEDAEIVEIIDHHRLSGNITSKDPIYYLNEPVGSTCTLIARKFKRRAMSMERGVALCLIAGIISDTLNLTSPTTTDIDREILHYLAEMVQVDVAAFTQDFFDAGSLLKKGTIKEMLLTDRKSFFEFGYRLVISQIEELDVSSLEQREAEIIVELDNYRQEHNVNLAALIVTDIIKHDSFLIIRGDNALVRMIPYQKIRADVWLAPKTVSRKKQVFPLFFKIMQQLADS